MSGLGSQRGSTGVPRRVPLHHAGPPDRRIPMTRPLPTRARTRTSRLVGVALTLTIAMMATGATAHAAVVPKTGVLFGAYVAPYGGRSFVDSTRAFENSLGRKLGIVNKFHDWSMINFSDEKTLTKSGHLVLVSWHPTDGGCDPDRAKKVANGRYDTLIRNAARNMKAVGGPILLRWDFEMTQDPGQWEYTGTPSEFIRAWRHMYTIFHNVGATNVKFTWAPQTAGFSDGSAPKYWPGGAYVDWIEASDVMGGHYWPTFGHAFGPYYKWASQRGKPLIAWAGIPERPNYPNWKANWFDGMRSTIKNAMPKIKATVYFHATTFAGNFHANTTTQAWNHFKSFSKDTYYNRMT
jgi:hypothetical protein